MSVVANYSINWVVIVVGALELQDIGKYPKP